MIIQALAFFVVAASVQVILVFKAAAFLTEIAKDKKPSFKNVNDQRAPGAAHA